MSVFWPTKVSCSTVHLRNSHAQFKFSASARGRGWGTFTKYTCVTFRRGLEGSPIVFFYYGEELYIDILIRKREQAWLNYPQQQQIQSVPMESVICALRVRFSARERKGGGELAVKLKYTCNTFSRTVIKRWRLGICPGYYERFPQLLSKENIRKIEPQEIPSCLIPRLLDVFTQQLEILATTLSEGNSKTSSSTLAFFYYTTINHFTERLDILIHDREYAL